MWATKGMTTFGAISMNIRALKKEGRVKPADVVIPIFEIKSLKAQGKSAKAKQKEIRGLRILSCPK